MSKQEIVIKISKIINRIDHISKEHVIEELYGLLEAVQLDADQEKEKEKEKEKEPFSSHTEPYV